MNIIVNVATGRYTPGQRRLWANEFLDGYGRTHNGGMWIPNPKYRLITWADTFPAGTPGGVPYAFKAFALKEALQAGASLVLWVDACILPIAPLDALWSQIQRDGAWICRNGWTNYQWTAESAYPDLGITPEENKQVPHVVATAFGLNLDHPTGRSICDEYIRLAGTDAFRGPWWNRNHPPYGAYPHFVGGRRWCEPCGPSDVLGHRHDQTALSVLAHRHGVRLTDPPNTFAYRGGETADTILVADANY